MEIAYCPQCKVDRKVTEIMGGEHLVFATCGHVVPIALDKSRRAYIETIKGWSIKELLDRLQATVLMSSYGSGDDQIKILRAEIISRVDN